MPTSHIRKRLISAHHDYQLYAVDATALRTSDEGNEEFGNFAIHDEFPHLIGKNEIDANLARPTCRSSRRPSSFNMC